jgi:hypothetical protein
VQRVHPNGVTGWLDLPAASGSLEDAQLNLELRRMAAEGLEGLTHALGVVPPAGPGREIFDARQRRQRCLLALSTFGCHGLREYGDTIGGIATAD